MNRASGHAIATLAGNKQRFGKGNNPWSRYEMTVVSFHEIA
jgi:hypothetical protein